MHFSDYLCNVCRYSNLLCKAQFPASFLHHEMTQTSTFSLFEHKDTPFREVHSVSLDRCSSSDVTTSQQMPSNLLISG